MNTHQEPVGDYTRGYTRVTSVGEHAGIVIYEKDERLTQLYSRKGRMGIHVVFLEAAASEKLDAIT